MQQQITRGDYLKDFITVYLENNLNQDITDLYDLFIFQCGRIQKTYTPAQVFKVSLDEQESQLLKNTNTAYLAGITKDGHKETFDGSITFDTRGQVVDYGPAANASVPASSTSAASCGCQGLNVVYSNCCQPAIKAYFSINYVPSKLSELTNDTDFIDSFDVERSVSIHNNSTEAHPYIQGLISSEASTRASQTEALEVSIAQEVSVRAGETEALGVRIDEEISVRAGQTEALSGSIQAEATAREAAVSAAISTTEGYTDTHIAAATTAINTTIGTLSSLDTSSKTDIVSAINSEVSDRQSADNNLQGQIDAIVSASDVTDIVGTYADLQAYDKTKLTDQDIIKVLSDSTHDDKKTYYRYSKSLNSFSYIGAEADSYTKAESDSKYVPKTTKVNNKALSGDISLTASDVGALPSSTVIGDANITIQRNGSAIGTINTNQTTAGTINISVPTTATEVGALPSTTTINDLTTTAQQNALNSGVTSSVVSQVSTNTSAIATNTSAIASNTSVIAQHTTAIANNTSAIASNTSAISGLKDQLDLKQDKDDIVYDLLINDANESNPSNAVSYAGINTSYTPSIMNYSGGAFNYGSWADAFFLKLFKPCMLKYDGTVDYFLDPANYAYKDDKITPSDVSDTTYGGNAMVQIGQIWISEANTTDGKKHIRIANRKLDDSFECYTHKKKDGTYADYIYRSLFDGCSIDSKIRSIKGQAVNKNTTGDNQLTYAQANGAGWNIEEYALRRTINYLLILMGKSLNTQAKFGQGVTSGGEAGQVQTGTLSNKGMFWGSNGTTSAVKVFHMENLWGNTWKLTNGLILAGGKLKYKMCEGTYDGSTTDDYNKTGNGYIDSGITPGGTSGGFISEVTLIPGIGLVPKTMSGTDSTYYCDGCWYNTGITAFARFGGTSYVGSRCGAFSCYVNAVVGYSYWDYGVALSYKKSS